MINGHGSATLCSLAGNKALPYSPELERAIVTALVLRPEMLGRAAALEADSFADLHMRAIWCALLNVQARGEVVNATSVIDELAKTTPAISPAEVGAMLLDGHGEPDEDRFDTATRAVAAMYRARVAALEVEALTTELIAPFESPAFPAATYLMDIDRRRNEPWISLALGDETLAELRPGNIALLIGGTGRGKTTLALALLKQHARLHGPALACSLELPGDELVARSIGMATDASWADVLRGKVPMTAMADAVPTRFEVLDRGKTTAVTIAQSIDSLRVRYPRQPVLVVVDYVQLMADDDENMRHNVGRAMRALDAIARDKRCVIIVLSQGSRVSSRELSSGEKLGAETADTGAESAALERWASVTLAIGKPSEPADDGSRTVDLSIGKGRMLGGDSVVPGKFWGRSGKWLALGPAVSAASVREGRKTEGDSRRNRQATLALTQAISSASAPVTATDVITQVGCGRNAGFAVIAALLADGVIVHVGIKSPRSTAWKLWTREKATLNGVRIVEE